VLGVPLAEHQRGRKLERLNGKRRSLRPALRRGKELALRHQLAQAFVPGCGAGGDDIGQRTPAERDAYQLTATYSLKGLTQRLLQRP